MEEEWMVTVLLNQLKLKCNQVYFKLEKLLKVKLIFGDRVDFGDFNRKIHAPLFKKGQKDELVCRICQPNHKEGPFNKPTKTYKKNPI